MESVRARHCRVCGEEKPLEREFFRFIESRQLFLGTCRICQRAQRRAYRRAHPELQRAERRRSLERDPEKHRTRYRRWAENNRELLRAKRRIQRATHKEQLTLKHRLWRQTNPDARKRAAERASAWRAANPERTRTNIANAKARRRGAPGSFTTEQWVAKVEAYANRCHWCGEVVTGRPQKNHVIPVTKGGSNNIGNIVPSCPSCNRHKSAKLPHEWIGRLL